MTINVSRRRNNAHSANNARRANYHQWQPTAKHRPKGRGSERRKPRQINSLHEFIRIPQIHSEDPSDQAGIHPTDSARYKPSIGRRRLFRKSSNWHRKPVFPVWLHPVSDRVLFYRWQFWFLQKRSGCPGQLFLHWLWRQFSRSPGGSEFFLE